MTKKGWLIAFEGIDGAGKKTLSSFLQEQLIEHGLTIKTFRYPDYESPWGGIIRRYLDGEVELDPVEQFFTYFTDIIKDQSVIEELLAQGDTVIVDRYFASTVAFQTAQGFYFEQALAILKIVKPLIPDIGFFVEVAPQTAMQRCQKRTTPDRHERDLALLTTTARQYRMLVYAGVLAKKWIIIDGNKDLASVKREITEFVSELLANMDD